MIVVVDYGMGNLRSVQKAFESCGYEAVVSAEPRALAKASGVVLPGVGAFGRAMAELKNRRLVEPLLEAIKDGKPFLGICLGLHLLFEESSEFGRTRGLGVIPGRVVKFTDEMKIPHMGWNQVEFRPGLSLAEGIPPKSFFYFVHSYYVEPTDESWVAGRTEYGVTFTSAVAKGNVAATQFHPEKSQSLGLRIIKNFGEKLS